MRRITRGPDGDPGASRGATIVVGFVVVSLAVTLLTVGARSPYSHSNLGSGYDPQYVRTEQIAVDDAAAFAGLSPQPASADVDPISRGAHLFVTDGCATCHGLAGRGGPVGPRIAGTDAKTIAQRMREGPGGMPEFSADALTDDTIASLAAYLASVATGK